MASAEDNDRIEELIAIHLPSLRAFIRSRLRPELRLKESSSDLVQSVCRELLTSEEGFEFRGEDGLVLGLRLGIGRTQGLQFDRL